VSVRDAREQAIAQLSDAFAHDVIEVEEFERRLTRAHRVSSLPEIAAIVSDLAVPAVVSLTAQAQALALESEHAGQGTPRVTAILGGVERHGAWTLPRQLQVRAILGGVLLDFREARFMPGVTEVEVSAVLGGIQLIVPPWLSVEVSGRAILGGFGHVERVAVQADPDRPVLRVHGKAILGGVAVETRLLGESETDAHRRRHEGRILASPDIKRLPR
jgi:hypothetical protein